MKISITTIIYFLSATAISFYFDTLTLCIYLVGYLIGIKHSREWVK